MPLGMNRDEVQGELAAGGRDDRGEAESAYRRIRNVIVNGKLAPGSRIVATEVAERLGVSRTPVRTALQQLRQEGYVVRLGEGKYSGVAVAPLTGDDARELFLVMGQLEGLAARECAGESRGERLEVVERMRRNNTALEEAVGEEHPDPVEIFRLDRDIHQAFVDVGAGPRLTTLHGMIKPQAERYVRFYVRALIDQIEPSVEEHAEIILCLEDGRPDEAERSVKANWKSAARRLSTVIDQQGELGSW